MSDWRTARAPYATRSRLPEDDLPEIDWGAASFTHGGGDEPEPEPMPDPSEEERAMARLRARIAERDAPLIDPWSQAQAAPMGPQSPPLPGSPAPLRVPRDGRTMAGAGLSMGMPEMLPPTPAVPPMTPQQAAQAAFRQPALDAVRAGVGAVTPPVDPMAPPPTPTAPDAVPQATTNPGAPTVTAGSQAAGLAQRPAAPQSPTTDPTGAPQFAMGATGLGGAQSGMSDRVAAGAPDGNVFGRQLDAARNEDVRRERIRRIILGIGAMLGAGTGNMGLMLPAAIGAGLVRDPDEEATLRANDERAQAVGGAQAEQRALLEQLAMRREAQQAQERQGQQTLALRAAELHGTQADRATRTGLAVAEEGRAADDRDPDSARSGRVRSQFRQWLRTAPAGIVRNVDQGSLDGMAAEELILLQEELSSNYNSNLHGGGRGVSGGAGESRAGGGLSGSANVAPDAYVLGVQQANPRLTPEQARTVADQDWSALRPSARNGWQVSREGVALSQALAQRIPGYTRENADALPPEQFREAREAAIQRELLETAIGTAIDAVGDIEALGTGEEAEARAGDVFGMETHPAVSAYNAARSRVMGILADMNRTGVINEAEYHRFVRDLPDVSNPRQAVSGSRRLQAILQQSREAADIRTRALGFRRDETGVTASGQPTTTADAPPAPEREHTITIRATRNGETRSRTVPISEADAWRAEAERNGWVVQ